MIKFKKIYECFKNIRFFKSYIRGVAPLFELSYLLHTIKEKKNVNTLLDIGSNKGQFSLIAKDYFSDINIHSFEPLIEEMIIQRKILGKKNINYYNFALGSKSLEKNIFITSRRDSSSILKPNSNINKIYKTDEIRKISIKSLDEIFDKKKLQTSILLKLDVQGYELEVLKGAKNLLHRIEYIITEISFKEIYENQAMANELINYLRAYNFEIHARCNRTKFNGSDFQEDVLFKKK